MASVRLFVLLATLAVAAANPSGGYHHGNEPYPVPNEEAKPKTEQPSCGGCQHAKEEVLKARGKCCQEVSRHVECLCPTMNTLISAGVPLKEVCYDDMACKKSEYGNTGSVLIDPSKKCSVPEVCNDVVDALGKLNKCFSDNKAGEHSAGGDCFAKALHELGFKNPAKLV